MTDRTRTRGLIGLIDLTSLNDARDDDIAALCRKARTPFGPVAAVCSWPEQIGAAKAALGDSGIPIAAVLNFPAGIDPPATVCKAAQDAVAAGAQELDLVWPYRRWLAGEREPAVALVRQVRAAAGDAVLKVILESGVFASSADLARASRDVIAAGADFLKTSSGKIAEGASLSAARTMLEAIQASERQVGFKASGGIRSLSDAEAYRTLAEDIMGAGWPSSATFRIGASRLLDEVLDALS